MLYLIWVLKSSNMFGDKPLAIFYLCDLDQVTQTLFFCLLGCKKGIITPVSKECWED